MDRRPPRRDRTRPLPAAATRPARRPAARARAAEIERLTALGYTPSEAVAYLTLLEAHPATAYEVSKRGALTKGNTYLTLQSLVAKGAAQPVSADPVRYAPVDPQTLFGQLSRTMSRLCADLAATLAQPAQDATEHVWTLMGDAAIDAKVADMIAAARRQIWIKGPDHLLARHLAPLRAAARRGVSVLVILFGDAASRAQLRLGRRARVYLHEGTGHMLAVGTRQFVVATDFSDTLIADYAQRSQAAYTRSAAVVFMAETMIRHEVYLAEIIQAHGAAIERRFGKDLIRLRRHYLPPPLLREARKRVKALKGSEHAPASARPRRRR